MNNQKNIKRDFMIKGNSLKRLIKEHLYYGKEIETIQTKINNMYADGSDQHDVNKQKECLQESQNVKIQIREKVIKARDELQNLFNENTDEEVKETEEYKNAEAVLNDGLEHFNDKN